MSAATASAELDLGLPPLPPASSAGRGSARARRERAKPDFFVDVHYPPHGSQSSLSPAATAAERPAHPLGVAPLHASPTRRCDELEAEFRLGMSMLGFDTIAPQQWEVADVCNSLGDDGHPLYTDIGLLIPRRSGKSESTTALALGRCMKRPGYRVAIVFATTATKLATKWKTDVLPRVERWSDEHYAGLVPVYSNGHEGIKFPNGSVLLLLPPLASAFRSEAFDLVIFDEAGEASAAMTELLLEAAGPTLDTRPDGQMWIVGTPAKFRAGNLLWDALEQGRDPDEPEAGSVQYGLAEELTLEDVETWEKTLPLLQRAHPGNGTLTTMPKLRANYRRLGPAKFAREYLGQFGRDAATAGIINPARWKNCETEGDLPQLPAHFAAAFGVSWDQAHAGIVAAWREGGVAHIGVLEYAPATSDPWLARTVNELAAAHPRAPLAHDSRGPVLAEAEKITQERRRTRLAPQTWREVQTGAALLVREVHTGNLIHYGQESLTEHAIVASRRGTDNAFAFGRPSQDAQILLLELAALALRIYDETPARRPMPQLVA